MYKNNIGTPVYFEPVIDTQQITLGKMLPGSPFDRPGLDRTCRKLKYYVYTSLCLPKVGSTYGWLQLYLNHRYNRLKVYQGTSMIQRSAKFRAGFLLGVRYRNM